MSEDELHEILNEALAKAWDEGREWSRQQAHDECMYYKERAGIFGKPTVTNAEIQPYRDALDAVNGPEGVTEYNNFIHSIAAGSIEGSLTHFEGNEEYEADEEQNPYRKSDQDG